MRAVMATRLAATICIVMLPLLVAAGPTEGSEDDHKGLWFNDGIQIDADRIEKRDRSKPFFFDMQASEGSKFYFTADIGTDFRVWLDQTVVAARKGNPHSRSLAISISSDRDANEKDKIVFSPLLHRTSAWQERPSREMIETISFDLKLDPLYEVPSYWLIHLQVWQCCGAHPPLTLEVLPSSNKSDDVIMVVRVRDDETAALPKAKEVGRFQFDRGAWHHIQLRMKLGPNGGSTPGAVDLSIDGRASVTYRGAWGYLGGKSNRGIGIDIGSYRRRQATKQIIYIDNVRLDLLSSSGGEVDVLK